VEVESKGIGIEPIKMDVLGSREVVVEEGTTKSVSAEGVEEETCSAKGVFAEICALEIVVSGMEIGQEEDSAIRSVALDKGRDKGGDCKGVDEAEKGKIDS